MAQPTINIDALKQRVSDGKKWAENKLEDVKPIKNALVDKLPIKEKSLKATPDNTIPPVVEPVSQAADIPATPSSAPAYTPPPIPPSASASTYALPTEYNASPSMQPKTTTNPFQAFMHIIALVLGILAFLFTVFPFAGVILAVGGIVAGVMGKKHETKGTRRRKIAQAGFIISIIMVVGNASLIVQPLTPYNYNIPNDTGAVEETVLSESMPSLTPAQSAATQTPAPNATPTPEPATTTTELATSTNESTTPTIESATPTPNGSQNETVPTPEPATPTPEPATPTPTLTPTLAPTPTPEPATPTPAPTPTPEPTPTPLPTPSPTPKPATPTPKPDNNSGGGGGGGGVMVWLPASGDKYHSKNNCGSMNPDRASQTTKENAINNGYSACSRCW